MFAGLGSTSIPTCRVLLCLAHWRTHTTFNLHNTPRKSTEIQRIIHSPLSTTPGYHWLLSTWLHQPPLHSALPLQGARYGYLPPIAKPIACAGQPSTACPRKHRRVGVLHHHQLRRGR
eukprot:2209524-Amphidinium_carterae.4